MNKHAWLALLLLLGGVALLAQPYAQNLFFSEYVEGSSNNKALEIFNGTGAAVDLSQYTVKLASNGGTWSTTNVLTPTGTLAHNDVFVIANAGANAAILALSDVTSTVTYYNGNDCVGLFLGDTLIDIIGVYQNDPGNNLGWPVAGVENATKEHTLIRKPEVDAGNLDFADGAGTNQDDSEWIVQGQDYITDLGTHTFTPGGGNHVATPVFNPGGGIYTSPVSVTMTCATAGASIHYTTDGSTPNASSLLYSGPITIGGTTTLKAIGSLPGMDDSYVATAVYLFPVAVANLTVLRASPADGTTVYQVSGEAILTFQQSFRNQKFLQDGGAGILIDDLAGVITSTYNVGDGVTGIVGKISEFGGMLQFVPTQNTPPASSTGNAVTPVVISYEDLINNFDAYESRVVTVPSVTFYTPTGNFANGTVYPTYDPDMDYNIRTTFYDVDYIGTPIPTTAKDITGIPNSRATEGNLFTPRSLADFADPAGAVATPVFSHPSGYYESGFTLTITCATPGASIYYTFDGSDPTLASSLYTGPMIVLASGTIKARAYLNANEFSGIASATYNFLAQTENLAILRGAPLQGWYMVTSEVLVSFKQSYRNQIFVQDGLAGILIDDPEGIITSTYAVGDGITGLVGILGEYGGMLQLTPTSDPGASTSNGNEIVPLPLSLAQFNADFELYESRLVKLMDVRFTAPAGNFANGAVYPIEDQSGSPTTNFRASFYDVDYIGDPVYPQLLNLSGIPNSRSDGNYITSRNIGDFQLSEVIPPGFTGYYSEDNPDVVQLSVSYAPYNFSIIPDGLSGYRLYRNNTLIMEHGAYLTAEWVDTVVPGTYTYYATAMYGTTESGPSETYVYSYTANPENPPAALETALLGNYPNPFNPSTSISFSLKEAAPATLGIYNQKGQMVRQLVNASLPAGQHSAVWDGRDEAGNEAGSGIYFYRLISGSFTNTKKMLMLK